MTQASIRLHPHSRSHRAQESRLLSAERFRISPARRFLDVTVSATALLFAVPVLALAALLILLTDGRPVFFTQARIGEGGREFPMHKLRSMRVCAAGAGVTTSGDPRITRIGRLLRALSIDELPQLWHVLRGQMTLVGPRPESVGLARRYPGSCRFVLQARPGLTGPSQLTFREAAATPPVGWSDPEEWYLGVLVPLRTQADLEYLLQPSLARTVRWLWATVRLVLGHGPGISDITQGPSSQ
jgi:lipopolysaccharide/colanic/teichoic acid biosynthesis glycosyltransferase